MPHTCFLPVSVSQLPPVLQICNVLTVHSIATYCFLNAAGAWSQVTSCFSRLFSDYDRRWVQDIFKPYIWRNASESVQLTFGKIMAFAGLSIGVGLSIKTLQSVDPVTAPAGKPDLSGLFSLQVCLTCGFLAVSGRFFVVAGAVFKLFRERSVVHSLQIRWSSIRLPLRAMEIGGRVGACTARAAHG